MTLAQRVGQLARIHNPAGQTAASKLFQQILESVVAAGSTTGWGQPPGSIHSVSRRLSFEAALRAHAECKMNRGAKTFLLNAGQRASGRNRTTKLIKTFRTKNIMVKNIVEEFSNAQVSCRDR